MEPNKVVQALKVLQDEGREDLIKEGVLEEAWVGLRRPKRISSGGLMAAVIACSSPQKKFKKFKSKSVEGRKVSRSPELMQDVWPQASGSQEQVVVRRWGAGRCSRHSGVSLASRVAAGGRGAGPHSAVAVTSRRGARGVSEHARPSARVMQVGKQAQSPRESGAERSSANLEEGTLGGTVKMVAASGKAFFVERSLEERRLDTTGKMAARKDCMEDVIIISDEESERQNSHRVVSNEENFQSAGLHGGMESRGVRRRLILDGSLSHEERAGNFGSQSVFKVGEQVEFVDKAGVVIRGIVCGETSEDGSIGRAHVLMDFWQSGSDEVNSGCGASRFSGGLSEVAVHREAGRPSGGQSLPVKVRAPLGH
ncbi:hypothetical protein NDU88_002208 [Pleurodeles waltl]|uniref:Uncharacterized protein n=1 Tax=Pleurodeles waltl TaxID=8319 RepID=A0AAV7VAK1_PLEWA|nr:hypothetical protein NDU88_002208 [Pleurodeles waltl]